MILSSFHLVVSRILKTHVFHECDGKCLCEDPAFICDNIFRSRK